MNKEDFLKRCIKEAYEVSIGMNTKRLFDFQAIYDEYKKIKFGTTQKDKDELVNRLIQLFTDIEKICRYTEQGEIKESSVILAHKICIW